jgi:ParB-like chromosome segregation protein Spo0J
MIPDTIRAFFRDARTLPMPERAALFNEMTEILRAMTGIDHPVMAVKLIPAEQVQSNDYNPNKVAPPEMRLLELSMARDGITMPIVAAKNDKGQHVIVDGFHRTQIIKYFPSVHNAMQGYVPVSELNKDIAARIAATVRHNMARGSHKTELSARLVALLKKHNWTDEKIGRELGMDADEVLRLKQLTGLADAFADGEFSKSWI